MRKIPDPVPTREIHDSGMEFLGLQVAKKKSPGLANYRLAVG